jgi:hypothetical protein
VAIYVGVGTHKRAFEMSGQRRNKPWREYVAENGEPDVEILYEGLTQEAAWAAEELLIDTYKRIIDGGTLLNASTGGRYGGAGVIVGTETRTKMSDTRRGRKLSPLSPEWRANIAAAKRGKKMPREAVEKTAAANRGRKRGPISAAVSAAVSEANRRRWALWRAEKAAA